MMMVGNLFGWLLRVSWQASVVALIILVVQWALQKRLTARWRYTLWLVLLAKLLLPAPARSPLSIFNYARFEEIMVAPRSQAAPQAAPRTVNTPVRPTTVGSVGTPAALESLPAIPAASDGESIFSPRVPKPGRSQRDIPSLFSRKNTLPLCGFLWISGVLLLASRIVGQNICFARRLHAAKPLTTPAIADLFARCRAEFAITCPIRLAQTRAVASPALYGLLRPTLLLPEQMVATFSHEELNYILLHELAHVKRRDMAVHWLETALKVLHWFNPVLWVAFRQMAADREMACDELALTRAAGNARKRYGETIIRLLESCVRPEPLPGLIGILEEKNQMVRRISMIAKFERRSRWPVLPLALPMALALVGLTDAQPKNSTDVSAAVAAQTPSTAASNPSYHGRSAEEWFNDITFNLNDRREAKAIDAFCQMGESGLPFLRQKLRSPKTPAESKRTAPARRKASFVLLELGPLAEPAIPDLIASLGDDEDTVACYAAMALGGFGPRARSAVPALVESLRSGDGTAGVALAQVDPDNSVLVPLLIEILKGPNSAPSPAQPKQQAVMALGRLGPRAKSAIPVLRETLDNPTLRFYSARALQRIAPEEPKIVAEANAVFPAKSEPVPNFSKLIEDVKAAPEGSGPGSRDFALQRLGREVQAARNRGAPLSNQFIQETILPFFTQKFNSSDPRIWGSASVGLSMLGSGAAPLLPALIGFVEKDDSVYRASIIGAFSQIAPGDASTLPVLIRLLSDWSDAVRGNACAALAHFGPEAKEALAGLHERLKDPKAWVRFNATLALWRIAHEAPSVSVLQDALLADENDGFIPLRTLEMLGGLNQQSGPTLAIIRDLAQHWDPEVRSKALALMAKLGEKPNAPQASAATVLGKLQ